MSGPFQSNQGQATAAGKLVFHFAPAWIEAQILEHVYPKDPIKALEMLLETMKVDQLISQQVREANVLKAQRIPVGLPNLGLPGTHPQAQPTQPSTPSAERTVF